MAKQKQDPWGYAKLAISNPTTAVNPDVANAQKAALEAQNTPQPVQQPTPNQAQAAPVSTPSPAQAQLVVKKQGEAMPGMVGSLSYGNDKYKASDAAIDMNTPQGAVSMSNSAKAYLASDKRKIQPWNITHDEHGNEVVRVEKPEAHLRDMEAEFRAMLVNDLHERQKSGYYKDATPEKLLDGSLINHVTGELIDDGSATGQYMKQMTHQLQPALDSFRRDYGTLRSIAGDKQRIKNNTWQISKSELGESDNTTKNFAKGFSDFTVGTVVQAAKGLNKLLHSRSSQEEEAKKYGFQNPEEAWDAQLQTMQNTASDLGSALVDHISKRQDANAFQNSQNVVGDLFSDYTKGVESLRTNQLSSEVREKLLATGHSEEDVAKIESTDTLGNALINASVRMMGELAPGGSMALPMKVAHGATAAYRLSRVRSALTGVEKLASTMGTNVLENTAIDGVGVFEKIIANADKAKAIEASLEGKKYLAALRLVNETTPTQRLLADGFAFGMKAAGEGRSADEIEASAINGAAFGVVNGVIGRTFANLATRDIALMNRLTPEVKKLLEPTLNNRKLVSSVLANLVANPVGSLVGGALASGDLSKLVPFDDKSRRSFLVNTITGTLFGAHEVFSLPHNGYVDSRHASEYYNIAKEYHDAVRDMADRKTFTLEDAATISGEAIKNATAADSDALVRKKKDRIVAGVDLPKAKSPSDVHKEVSINEDMTSELRAMEAQASAVQKQKAVEPPIDHENEDMAREAFDEIPMPTDSDFHSAADISPTEERSGLTQRQEFDMRYKHVTGKDFDPATATSHEFLQTMLTPVHGGEKLDPLLATAVGKFMKNAPEDLKIKFTDDLSISGQQRAMAFNDKTNTILINNNHESQGNLAQLAHSFSEEFLHSITVDTLKNPETASKVDADRTQMYAKFKAGDYDDLKLKLWDGSEQKIGTQLGREMMEYYLGNNEEFVAGAYNSNLPLAEILKSTKLPGQKRFSAFERIKSHFGKEKSLFDDYIDLVGSMSSGSKEDSNLHGVFPLGIQPITRDPSAHLREIEKVAARAAKEEQFKGTTSKATDALLKDMYGTSAMADVTKHWANVMRKESSEAVVKSAAKAAEDYCNKAKVTDEVSRLAHIEEAKNRARAYVFANNMNERVLPIAYVNGKVHRIRTQEELAGTINLDDPTALSTNPVTKNGDGKDFEFSGKGMVVPRKTMNQVLSRVKDSSHATKYIRQVLPEFTKFKRADLQHVTMPSKIEDAPPDVSMSFPPMPAAERTAINKDILAQTGVYTFPRGESSGDVMVDMSDLFSHISDIDLPGVHKKPVDGKMQTAMDFLHHTHNFMTMEWLNSYEGGNKPELTKAGNLIDVGKLITKRSMDLEHMDQGQLVDAICHDELTDPKFKERVMQQLTDAGFTGKQAATMREAVRPLWDNPYTGELNPFGRANEAMKPIDAAFEAINLMHTFTSDASLKSLAREKKADGVIKAGKGAMKYGGVSLQSDAYKQFKSDKVMKAALPDSYADKFDANGKPIAEQWKASNTHLDSKGLHQKMLMLSSELLAKQPEEVQQWVREFTIDANTDGGTILFDRGTRDFFNDIVGKDHVDTFKNAYVHSDPDHTQYVKTAFHFQDLDKSGSEHDNYPALSAFVRSLKQQGICGIVFDSAIKSGGTNRLKETTLNIPGAEGVPMGYTHQGKLVGENADAIQDATYSHVLSGGEVPQHMIMKMYLSGENGEGISFITSSEGSKRTVRNYSQEELAHAQPGGDFHQNYSQFIKPYKASNNAKLQSVVNGLRMIAAPRRAEMYSDQDKRDLGNTMRVIHENLYNAFTSPDKDAKGFTDDNILHEIAQSYHKAADGSMVADPARAHAVLATYGLDNMSDVKKGSPLYKALHTSMTDYAKNGFFGGAAKLMPYSRSKDHVEYAMAKEIARIRKTTDDVGLQEAKIEDAVNAHLDMMSRHFDENGDWLPTSNGMMLGERDLERINNAGRAKHGTDWEQVKVGSKVFADLKPTDALSSNMPLEIVGVVEGGVGMMLPPHISETLGRDFDNDDLGYFTNTPDWGEGNFSAMWNLMRKNGVGFSSKERDITVGDQKIGQKELTKMLSVYKGQSNAAAEILGAPIDIKGMHPLDGNHYTKQIDCDSSQGAPIALLAAYASYRRNHIDAPVKGVEFKSSDPDTVNDIQARLSFWKQYGVVDKFALSPVDWNTAFWTTVLDNVNGVPATQFAKEKPSEFQKITQKLSKEMFDSTDNSKRAIEKKVTEEVRAAGDGNSVADIVAKHVNKPFDEERAKELAPLTSYADAVKRKQYIGWSQAEYGAADPLLKASMMKDQGTSFLRGMPINKKAGATIWQGNNASLGCEFTPNDGFHWRFKHPNGETLLTPQMMFNPDGTPSKYMERMKQAYGVPEDVFLSAEDGNGYYIRNAKTGKTFKMFNYSKADEATAHDRIGRAIATFAKATSDPDRAASDMIMGMKLNSGSWRDVLSGVKSEGVNPVTDGYKEREYGSYAGYDPKSGNWKPIEKVGQKWVMLDKEIGDFPGEVQGKVKTKVKDLTEGGQELISEVATVKLRKPLETDILHKVAADLGDSHLHGAFSLGFKRETPRLIEDLENHFGDGLGSLIKDGRYPEVFDKLEEYVTDKFGKNVSNEEIQSMLEQISPAWTSNHFGLADSGAALSETATRQFLLTRLPATVNAIENLSRDYGKLWNNPIFRKSVNAVSWVAQDALALIDRTSKNRRVVKDTDVESVSVDFHNGVAREGKPTFFGDNIDDNGNQFLGTHSMSDAQYRFLSHINRSNDTKVLGEGVADKFAEASPVPKTLRDGKEHDTLALMRMDGLLENNLPEVSIDTTYNSDTHEMTGSTVVVVDGIKYDNITAGLEKHYEKIIPDAVYRKNAVDGMATLIDMQRVGRQHANLLGAMDYNRINMFAANKDIVGEYHTERDQLARQRSEEIKEKIDYFAQLSPLQAHNELMHVPIELAHHSFMSLVAKDGFAYTGMYEHEPDVQVDRSMRQQHLNYDLGQKLFGWAEDYHSLVKADPAEGYVINDPLMNSRMAFMKNFIEKKLQKLNYDAPNSNVRVSQENMSEAQKLKEIYEAQGKTPEELLAPNISTGQILMALSDITKDQGILEGYMGIAEPEANRNGFKERMRNDLHVGLKDQSTLALGLYSEVQDSDPFAHKNISWMLSNAYGQSNNFGTFINPDNFKDEVHANIGMQNGIMHDTPSLPVGQMCVVQHSNADMTQGVITGRYIGSYLPDIVRFNKDTQKYEKTGEFHKTPYSVFYNEGPAATHVIPTRSVSLIAGHTENGYGDSITRKTANDAIKADEYMRDIRDKTIALVDKEGEALSVRTSLESKSKENYSRSIPLRRVVEKSLYDTFVNAPAKYLHAGGIPMLKMGMGIGGAVTGAGMAAMGMPFGTTLMGGGAALAVAGAVQMGMKVGLNVASNVSTATRTRMLFNDWNPIQSLMHKVSDPVKYAVELIKGTSGSDSTMTPQSERIAQKMKEHLVGTETQRMIGESNDFSSQRENVNNLVWMLRTQQKLQNAYENEYKSHSEDMQRQINMLDKNAADFDEQMRDFRIQGSWLGFLEEHYPDTFKEMAERQTLLRPGKDGTVNPDSVNARKAMEMYDQWGYFKKGLFTNMSKLAASGSPLLSAVGRTGASVMSGAMLASSLGYSPIRFMTETEATGARGAIKYSQDDVIGLNNKIAASFGEARMSDKLQSQIKEFTASITTGVYDKNADSNTASGRMASLFTKFNGALNRYLLSSYSERKGLHDTYKRLFTEDEDFAKYAENFGVRVGDALVYDPKKQLTNSMAANGAWSAAKMATMLLATAAMAQLFGDEKDSKLVKAQKWMEGQDFTAGNVDRAFTNDNVLTSVAADLAHFVFLHTNQALAMHSMQNSKTGYKAGTERQIGSVLSGQEKALKDAARQTNISPIISAGVNLGVDGIMMLAYPMFDSNREAFGERMASVTKAANTEKVNENAQKAYQYYGDSRWKTVLKDLSGIAPVPSAVIQNIDAMTEEKESEKSH